MKKELILNENTIDEIIKLSKEYDDYYGSFAEEVMEDNKLYLYIFGIGEGDLLIEANGQYMFIFDDNDIKIKYIKQ